MKQVADFSEFNGFVDWRQLAGRIDGAVIRLGYRGYGSAGALAEDSRAGYNLTRAVEERIPVGCYFLTQATTDGEAREEAAFCHEIIQAAMPGQKPALPVFADSEWGDAQRGTGRADRLTRPRRTQYAVTFVRELQALGYEAGLYCAESWARTEIDADAIRAEGAKIWLASVEHVRPQLPFDAWQYTWRGQLPGVKGKVDLSEFWDWEDETMTSDAFRAAMQTYRKELQDNDAGTWSAEARAWAVKTGLVQGGSDGAYMWQDFMTREQLVTVLYRFAQQMGKA